eukprot:2231082-Pleurochrysis_carterae.AAC.5
MQGILRKDPILLSRNIYTRLLKEESEQAETLGGFASFSSCRPAGNAKWWSSHRRLQVGGDASNGHLVVVRARADDLPGGDPVEVSAESEAKKRERRLRDGGGAEAEHHARSDGEVRDVEDGERADGGARDQVEASESGGHVEDGPAEGDEQRARGERDESRLDVRHEHPHDLLERGPHGCIVAREPHDGVALRVEHGV